MLGHSLVQDHMPKVIRVRPRKSWTRQSHWAFCSIWWSHANLPSLRIRRMAHTAMPCQRRTERPTLRVEVVIWGFNSDVSIYIIYNIWMFLDGLVFCKKLCQKFVVGYCYFNSRVSIQERRCLPVHLRSLDACRIMQGCICYWQSCTYIWAMRTRIDSLPLDTIFVAYRRFFLPIPGEWWSSCLGLSWRSGESLVAWWQIWILRDGCNSSA